MISIGTGSYMLRGIPSGRQSRRGSSLDRPSPKFTKASYLAFAQGCREISPWLIAPILNPIHVPEMSRGDQDCNLVVAGGLVSCEDAVLPNVSSAIAPMIIPAVWFRILILDLAHIMHPAPGTLRKEL